jgi:hypothetical protein
MKHFLVLFPVLTLLLAGCYKEPVAEGVIAPLSAFVGENISFTNYSQNAENVEWNMGDGTITSEFSPVYSYESPGIYNVILTAFGKKGDGNVAYFSVEILSKDPVANAVINPNPAWVGEEIAFTNLSTNTAYSEWDMGDGTVSTSFNLVHYYVDPGRYNVSLKAFNKNNDINIASFVVDITGSELMVIVKEYFDEYVIEDASVLLYASENDWYEADFDKAVGGEQFTNSYGECLFEGLSYQKYYVDVYYQLGNEGYVNWLLGKDDILWVETQEVSGGWDHTFIAYVEAVTFDNQKKSTGRPVVRPAPGDVHPIYKGAATNRSARENKISIQKERK